jgi:hypothetical protein
VKESEAWLVLAKAFARVEPIVERGRFVNHGMAQYGLCYAINELHEHGHIDHLLHWRLKTRLKQYLGQREFAYRNDYGDGHKRERSFAALWLSLDAVQDEKNANRKQRRATRHTAGKRGTRMDSPRR